MVDDLKPSALFCLQNMHSSVSAMPKLADKGTFDQNLKIPLLSRGQELSIAIIFIQINQKLPTVDDPAVLAQCCLQNMCSFVSAMPKLAGKGTRDENLKIPLLSRSQEL